MFKTVALRCVWKIFFLSLWTLGSSVNCVLAKVLFDENSRWCVGSWPVWLLGDERFLLIQKCIALCDIQILYIPCWKTPTNETEKCIFPVYYMDDWFNQDSSESVRFYADLFVPNSTWMCIALSWFVVVTLKGTETKFHVCSPTRNTYLAHFMKQLDREEL